MEKGARLQSLLEYLVDEPLQIPQWGPHGERCPSPEPSSTYPPESPEKKTPLGSPNRAHAETDAPPPEPSNYLLKFPVNGLPPRLPIGSVRRERERDMYPEISSTRSLVIHLSLKVPGKWPHPSYFQTGSLWREMVRLQSQWFIHLYPSDYTIKKPSQKKRGKNTVTVHGAPRGPKT